MSDFWKALGMVASAAVMLGLGYVCAIMLGIL